MKRRYQLKTKGGICMDCLEHFSYLSEDKGQFVCDNCYHKRYSKHKFVNQNHVRKNPTFDDLKKQLEKHW